MAGLEVFPLSFYPTIHSSTDLFHDDTEVPDYTPPPSPRGFSAITDFSMGLLLEVIKTGGAYGIAYASRWVIACRFDISPRVPEFVLIANVIDSVGNLIFERLPENWNPKENWFSFTVHILSTYGGAMTLATAMKMNVSLAEGVVFYTVISVVLRTVAVFFEE
jgi:hypothetical protein